MKKAILAASFGTSHADTEEKNIGAVEQALAARFPDRQVYRAYTSGMIMRAKRARGEQIDDLAAAFSRMQREGVQDVCVVATHVIPGEEYEKVLRAAKEAAPQFERLTVSRPLLDCMADIETVGRALAAHNPIGPQECLVLFGHGSEHYSNTVYPAMEHILKEQVCDRILVGTVEGYPSLDEVVAQITARGFVKARLVPLMLVAGDHAKNDMASDDPDSWCSKLQAAGVRTEPVIRGLGEYEEIRALYCAHAAAVMDGV